MYRSNTVTVAILSAVLFGATAGKASASGVLVSFDPGTTQRISEVVRYPVFGDQMPGLEVTAEFVGGGSETVSWSATGPNAGSAGGSGWSLVVTGHTYFPGGSWTLSTTSAALSRLTLDGGPGETAFDIFWGPSGNDEGTLGSYLGRTFTVTSAPRELDVEATYTDEVALVGEDPVGDLYRSLDIRFVNTEGLGIGSSFDVF